MDIEHDLAAHAHAEGSLHKTGGPHHEKLMAGLRKFPAARLSQMQHAITHVLKEKAQAAEDGKPLHEMSDAQFARHSAKMFKIGEE